MVSTGIDIFTHFGDEDIGLSHAKVMKLHKNKESKKAEV